MQRIATRLCVWAIFVAAILMIPLLAKWPWTGGDFIFGIVVLFGSALLYEVVARRGDTLMYKAAVAVAVATALLLVWVNAAVGLIGDGDLDSPNAIYLGMLVIGFVSALAVRFKPEKMASILFAIAIMQMAIPVIVFIFWPPPVISWAPGVVQVFGLNVFFAIFWSISGLLFRRSAV